jgi:hypothetical protein
MYRFGRSNQLLSVVFAFLTLALHCSQVCLATGHATATILVPLESSRNAEGHCHSQPATPREPKQTCVNCSMPVLVESISLSGERAASLAVSSVVFWLPPSFLPVSLGPRVERHWSSGAAPPLLSFLGLSVLRL